LSTGRKRHLLQRGEVIFGVGEPQPKSDIYVSRPNHMRYAKVIALDPDVILPGLGNQYGRIRRRRLVEAVSDDQECKGSNDESGKYQAGNLEFTHVFVRNES
jgi:hypothetical protein